MSTSFQPWSRFDFAGMQQCEGARTHRATDCSWLASGVLPQSLGGRLVNVCCGRLQKRQAAHWHSAVRQLQGSIRFGCGEAFTSDACLPSSLASCKCGSRGAHVSCPSTRFSRRLDMTLLCSLAQLPLAGHAHFINRGDKQANCSQSRRTWSRQ